MVSRRPPLGARLRRTDRAIRGTDLADQQQGALGLAVGLIRLLVGVSKGNDWGWGTPTPCGMIAAGTIVLLLCGWRESRHRDQLVDLRMTHNSSRFPRRSF